MWTVLNRSAFAQSSHLSRTHVEGAGVKALRMLATLAIVVSVGVVAKAQVGLQNVHPTLKRGMDDSVTADQHDPDSINLFNGNLTLAIPLGTEYPLRADWRYAFTLHYNSNIWDLNPSGSNVNSNPVKYSNAGLGWDLGFGRLIAPQSQGTTVGRWVFVSPDGTYHAFYSTLHEDVGESDPNDTYLYTRDGSNYRLVAYSDTLRFVEAPDGTQLLFELVQNEWRLKQIGDRFVNRLWVSYAPNLVTLTDSNGRTHRIYFRVDATGTYSGLVDRVELAAFNGTTAVYKFTYRNDTVVRPAIDTNPSTGRTMLAPVLTGISRPDGSQYGFEYHGTDDVNASGRLSSCRLPTLGRINWAYTTYSFAGPGRATALGPEFRSNVGVATRTVQDANGTEFGRWTYQTTLNPAWNEERELSNTVTTPSGHKQVYYFNVNTTSTSGVWQRSGFGLPGTFNQMDASGTKALAWQVLDCDSGTGACQPVRSSYVVFDQDASPNPSAADFPNSNRREVIRRTEYNDDLVGSTPRFAEVARSEYDGLGHFRRTVTSGNFGSGDTRETVVTYDASSGTYPSPSFSMPAVSAPWQPGLYSLTKVTEGAASNTTEYSFDRATGMLLRSRNRSTTSPTGGAASNDVVVVRTYDSKGQLSQERYFGGDSQPLGVGALSTLALPATDVYQVRHTYQFGVRATTQYFSNSSAAFGPRIVDWSIDCNSGLIATERDTSGLATDYEYDALGRIVWIKPQAGHGAWTNYSYVCAAGSEWDGAKILRNTVPNGGGQSLMYQARVLDSFGNAHIDQVRMPDGSFPYKITNYNALGWKESESESSNAPQQFTQYLDYDAMGRARTVRPPEGAVHDRTFQYTGVREVTETVRTGADYNATTGDVREEARPITRLYDRQGRLWKTVRHTVDQVGNPRDVITERAYDVGGRLVTTRVDGAVMGFTLRYDGRGFLCEQFRPDGERGPETTAFEAIDAKGHALRTRRYNHATSETYWLLFDRDRAERLIAVRDGVQTSKVWKEFTYADTNGTNDWRAGKLWKTKRFNDMSRHLARFGMTGATVAETFTYGGVHGRVSEYAVGYSDTLGRTEQFAQTYSYTDLGDVAEIGYPRSTGGYVTIGRNRTVQLTYSNGRLSRVSGTLNGQPEGWIDSVSYHPNGLENQIVHSNGVVDAFSLDPTGAVRAGGFATTGVLNPYTQAPDDVNVSPYLYDGAEHLVRAGNQYFVPKSPTFAPPPPDDSTEWPSTCIDGWFDPFGSVYATNDADCNARVFYYYTASDRIFKVEDGYGAQPRKTWYFYDLGGNLLTEYSTRHFHYSPWQNEWLSIKDNICTDLGVVGRWESAAFGPTRIRHFHRGKGATGIVTNENRIRQ